MSIHYRLLVEMDLFDELAEEDVATIEWLIGRGAEPPEHPDELSPIVYPEDPPDVTENASGSIPGGASGALSRRRIAGTGASALECWSLAVRTGMSDDELYGSGLAFLAWIGRRSREDGFIGLAREEGSIVPGWIFATYGGWTYLIAGGEVGPLESAAPDPPETLLGKVAASIA